MMPRGRPRVEVAPCEHCGKSFKRLQHLQRHERIHTNDRPFVCSCGATFTRQDLLSRHRRLVHPNGNDDESVHPSSSPPRPAPEMSQQHTATLHGTSDGTFLDQFNAESGATTWPNHDDTFDLFLSSGLAENDFLPAPFYDVNYSLTDWLPEFSAAIESSTDPNFWSQLATASQPASNIDSDAIADWRHSRRRAIGEPAGIPKDLSSAADSSANAAWSVSAAAYSAVAASVQTARADLPADFICPSRHSLSRYLEGYFRGFHPHLPLLHQATATPDTMSPALLLSLAAMGALYRFEHPKGYMLYSGARVLVNRQLKQSFSWSSTSLNGGLPDYAMIEPTVRTATAKSDPSATSKQEHLQMIQALVVLMALASWADKVVVSDALAMAGQLVVLVRKAGISESDQRPDETNWLDWIRNEERRRTLYSAYVLFTLQSIAFNVSPLLTYHELALYLPSCSDEWNARSAFIWTNLRSTEPCEDRLYQDTLGELLSGPRDRKHKPISAYANYVLINGILQHIFFERQTSNYKTDLLRTESVRAMEAALQAWQALWEATLESSLDPVSPQGPLGFTSSALLRLAYIRLNANLGPCRKLDGKEPLEISRAFTDDSIGIFSRTPNLIRAVLQCVHALSIPIHAGVAYVARTQSVNWSVVHCLCSLECALLLTRWLESLAIVVEAHGVVALQADEMNLLRILSSLLSERDYNTPTEAHDNDARWLRRMALAAVEVWAETLTGVNIFQIAHIVGKSLSIVADTMRERLGTTVSTQ